jgi:hypothetical protein
VLNKIDLLDKEGQLRVVDIFKNTLSGIIPAEKILLVSSRYALDGIKNGDRELVEKSGIEEIKYILFDEVPRYKEERRLSRKMCLYS